MSGTVVCDGDTCRMISPTEDAAAAKVTVLELMGSSLDKHESQTVDPATLCGKGKYLGIYFSAHWCPPCRGFTPKLADFYKDFKANHPHKDDFEIVFVSSDRDKESFEEYWKEMPWLALPFDKRDLKNKLSGKFKVQGIPSFIILDANTGEVVTGSGREAVMNDPKGKEFPWQPKPFHELIAGTLVDKDGKTYQADELLKGKVKLIYFSAHWCPPCRRFTPKFAETYNKLKASDKADKFEAVFVSSDRSEDQFKEYLAEMPWKAVPFSDRDRKDKLSDRFEVEGIPSLIVLDENDKVITTNGTASVGSDPDGLEFPWLPKPMDALSDFTISIVNESPVCFLIGGDKVKEVAEKAMLPAALKAIEKEEEMGFLYTEKTNELCTRVMEFANAQDVLTADGFTLMILDVPSQKVYKGPSSADMTVDIVNKFVADFKAGTLKGAAIGDDDE